MKIKQPKKLATMQRQQGVVLLVVLILVTIMTLGGVAAMRSTGVDTKIAASVRSKLNSLLLAENALSTGETALCNYLANTGVCTGAFIANFATDTTDGLHAGRQLVNMTGISGYTSVNSEAVGADKSYMIEFIETITPGGSSLAVGNNTAADIRYIFRVTASGESPNGGVSVVQSLFAARR